MSFIVFFTFFVAMILRFYSLCRGIGVVPFVPSWSVAVASVGPGLGGETDMTGATGFLDVAEDSRSPAEYGERTTAMVRLCMFLHFFCILTPGAAQPPSGNSTQPDCTSGSFER